MTVTKRCAVVPGKKLMCTRVLQDGFGFGLSWAPYLASGEGEGGGICVLCRRVRMGTSRDDGSWWDGLILVGLMLN